MPRYRLDLHAPPAWAPLERLCALCDQRRGLPRLRVADFMYMGCLVSPGRPSIHLYKNATTRHYLCLDDGGHAYRLRWQDIDGKRLLAACIPHRTLVGVLDGVVARLPAVNAEPEQAEPPKLQSLDG